MTLKMYFAPMLLVIVFAVAAQAQTGVFTYQGRMTDGTSPASGTYEMQFSLFDSLAGPTQIGTTLTNSSVVVTNGVFTANLDFSPATPFTTGANRFLEIAVRKASDPPGFTLLTPRQQITSSPYSIRTLSASAADSLSAACTSCVTDLHVSDTLTLGAGSSVHNSALPSIVMRTTGAIMTGPLDMGNNVITNIGAAGTDFDSFGGLTLASPLVANGGVFIGTHSLLGSTAFIDFTNFDVSPAGNVTATGLAVNSGAGPDALHTETGINRSSPVDETFTMQNSGLGRMNLVVDGQVAANGLQVGGGATITSILTATATLDFPNTIGSGNSDLTIAVIGAQAGDAVSLGVPTSSVVVNSSYSAWVSATDTVTVRFLNNFSSGAINPASGTFRVVVTRF